MTTHTEWANQTNRHVNLHERVLALADRRLSAIEHAADMLDRTMDKGSHPEVVMYYLAALRSTIDLEELEALSRIVSRSSRDVRLLTGAKMHDINQAVSMIYSLGYKVVPKREAIGKTEERKGLTAEQVDGIRQALGVQVLGGK